ncbi:MAG: sulfatase-like hydrolase/transferase, partial [Planctomycetaceae bacterium]
PDEETTLGEAFQSAGYATSCIGKWHLGHKPEFFPTRHGFDEYFGILYSNDMRPVQLVENETVVEYPVVQATLTRRYTQRALDFIERNKDRPFFLYLPHAMPHKPLAASEEFYKQSGAGLYGDVIAELDWSVGRVLDALKEHGLDEQTLVIFTSDNGPWFGGSTGGLRGMKGKTWEGGLRVPMIARRPSHIPAGKTIDTPCGSIDICPTVLAAAGIEVPNNRELDGTDIMPLLKGETHDPPHEALFGMQGQRLMTVRSGDWKLHVRSPGPTRYQEDASGWVDPRAPDGVTILAPCEQYKPNEFPGSLKGDEATTMMLFNLKTDPAEMHNAAEAHPEIVARLKALYDAAAKDVPEPMRRRRQRGFSK